MSAVALPKHIAIVDPHAGSGEGEPNGASCAGSEPAATVVAPIDAENRYTVHVPETNAVLSLGASTATEWDGWKGAFAGVTVATGEGLWAAGSGVCIAAGYTAGKPASADQIATAHKHGVAGIAWSEAAGVLFAAIDAATAPGPPLITGIKLARGVTNLGYAIAAGVEATTATAAEIEDGQLHLHASKEMLLSSGDKLISAGLFSNVMMGATAEVVGGVSAEVKAVISAELKAFAIAGVVGIAGAELKSRLGTEISCLDGEVAVAGKSISVGGTETEAGLFATQKATESVAVSASSTVELAAGGLVKGACVTVDGTTKEVLARSEGSYASVASEQVALRTPGCVVRLGATNVTLCAGVPPSSLPAALETARGTWEETLARAKFIKHNAILKAAAAAVGVIAGTIKTAVGKSWRELPKTDFTAASAACAAEHVAVGYAYGIAKEAADEAYEDAARIEREAALSADEAAALAAPALIVIKPDGIEIRAPLVKILAPEIALTAAAKLSLEAPQVEIKGVEVDIQGEARVALSNGAGQSAQLRPDALQLNSAASPLRLISTMTVAELGPTGWDVT